MPSSSSKRRRLFIGGSVAAVLLLFAGTGFALSTWGEVNRVTIDRPVASDPSPQAAPQEGESPAKPADDGGSQPRVIAPTEGLDVFLIVGSDSRDDLENLEGFGEFEGTRADVVMVLLRTEKEAAVLSIPRDLLVENSCTGGQSRINQMLEGCGTGLNGPTLLTIAVEDLIGQHIDHFALIDLAGFQGAVDAIGGYEICVENPVRDSKAKLELPDGCTMASGEQALAWLRSRRTQELTESGWRTMAGVNDLARNERQRAFLMSMMGRLADFSSPQDIAATAQAVAPFMTVDSELSLVKAVNLAWTMRGLSSGALTELEVPVYDHVTDDGAFVLLLETPLDQIVAAFVTPETADSSAMPATG
jgi:LCP family protein required for cell wall assembly